MTYFWLIHPNFDKFYDLLWRTAWTELSGLPVREEEVWKGDSCSVVRESGCLLAEGSEEMEAKGTVREMVVMGVGWWTT